MAVKEVVTVKLDLSEFIVDKVRDCLVDVRDGLSEVIEKLEGLKGE